MREVTALQEVLEVARQELRYVIGIKQSHARRVKRALIPIAGKALSWLFGTASKGDLRKIQKHIKILADNQDQLVHIMNDTISVLTTTNVEVRRNRHAIRSMSDEIHRLDQILANHSHILRTYMSEMHDFLLNYLQIDLMINEARESVSKAMFYIENMKMQLDQLTLGHLAPMVIQPEELIRVLLR